MKNVFQNDKFDKNDFESYTRAMLILYVDLESK